MRLSQLFPKTLKEAPKEASSVNHRLLARGGFVDQLMAGSWSILPLGQRVLTKINQIIRGEINGIGGQEMTMPLLHPKEVWNETGRWDKAREVMYQLKDNREREFALSFTHEEVVMDLLRKKVKSYKDLPVYVYQFSTKFRNEVRATGGLLRGREFLMKDLYSAHTSEEDLMNYYEIVKGAYLKIFQRLGLKVKVAEADGGVFTKEHTHEFQVINEVGEDIIYYCDACDFCQNKEVFAGTSDDACPRCQKGRVVEQKGAIEVANIFPLGTMYAEKMKAFFVDKEGKERPIWFGSYGIGPTRVMATLVEEYHDEQGIVWPEAVAPFRVHLIEVTGHRLQVTGQAEDIYQKLTEAGVEVLWDDRLELSAGEKFAEADLIGCPYRVVISEKSLAAGGLELKKRSEKELRIVDFEELLQLSLKTA